MPLTRFRSDEYPYLPGAHRGKRAILATNVDEMFRSAVRARQEAR